MSDSLSIVQPPLFSPEMLGPKTARKQADLHTRWAQPEHLPRFVTECAPAMRLLNLLGPLQWDTLPDRDLHRNWGQPTLSNAPLLAAYLLKLEEHLTSFEHLCEYLAEHAAFIWLFGFPLVPAPRDPLGFNAGASLPDVRHLARMLRRLPNSTAQFLLADSVRLIADELAARHIAWGECVSLDTKHIVARVKQNNPKAYVANRYNKAQQPAGDPDCRLGCKRRHNRTTTARTDGSAASRSVGEFYWGYGTGIVVTKVPGLGEFVLAELTQPFDHADLTYFYPLLHDTELRLGHKPRFGTFDAAFDAWYVYAYFSAENGNPDGLAAVPFSEKGGRALTDRHFAPDGLPLCQAGLPMPVQFTFIDHTSCLIKHERAKYICPITAGTAPLRTCPVHAKRWRQGGCTAMMPTSLGTRLRYQIDRHGELYTSLYRQRTACERINSQSVALGIEHPLLRNGPAIANQNTLAHVLINLRFLDRLRRGLPEDA